MLTLTGYSFYGDDTEHALEPGTQYRVRVQANNQILDADGNPIGVRGGDHSPPSSFAETLPGAPNAPAAPTVTQVGSGSVSLSWSAPDPYTGASPIHDYDLEVRLPGGAWAASFPAQHGAARSLTVTGLRYYGNTDATALSPSTDYEVRVRANNQERDADGNVINTRRGTWSAATTFRTAPGAPTGLIAVPQDGSVRLLWEQPEITGDEAGFRYVVEHADNEQFNGAGTAETTAGSVIEPGPSDRVVAGDWALVPDGVEDGQRFRLLFVTSGSTAAFSSDIATYNTFVQNAAGSGHQAIRDFNGEFTALVSTDAVDARDNTGTTGTGVPIWWVNGDKVADDYADFYDGSWDSNAPRTQTGAGAGTPNVKTGSFADGTGNDEVGGNSATYGLPAVAGQEIDSGGTRNNNFQDRLYALSPVLVAVTPPPPTELTVTGLTNGTETHIRVRAVRGTDAVGDWSQAASATPTDPVDYDSDDDGLIEIRTLAQLNAMRWDLDGNGEVAETDEIGYALAFTVPMAGMGCPAVVGETGGCGGYELMADLDFTGSEWAGGDGWLPIGHPGINEDLGSYSAVFHGNGRTISNLHIDRNGLTRVGLFTAVASGGVVRDVGLPGADVSGRDGVGALAGVNDGTVRRSWSTGSVVGQSHNVGGLVGWNGSGDLIADSWSAADASSSGGGDYVGGLAGRNQGTIRGSYATGQVSATHTSSGSNVGGLVGWNDAGTIKASYATGAVSSNGGQNLGGLAGRNTGSVSDAYATGAVTLPAGRFTAGGLVGHNDGGSIANSYSTGLVSGGAGNAGGLVGRNDGGGTVTGSYWNRETAGRTFGIGSDDADNDNALDSGETNTLPGHNTEGLQTPVTGVYSNWSADSWDFGATYNYPALAADLDGDGTPTWQEFGYQRDPGPVTGLAASRDGSGDIAVGWGEPESPGSGVLEDYQYRVSDDAGMTWSPDWTETTAPGHTFTPAADTGYTVEVRARNRVTQGTTSTVVEGAASRIGPPGAPEDLALAAYPTAIGMSWSAPEDDTGVTGYVVQYRTAAFCSDTAHADRTACEGASETWTAAGAWSDAARDSDDGLAAEIEGLTTDTAYDVRVAAASALGVSPYATATATATTDARDPGVPRNVTVLAGSESLEVGWDPPLDLGNSDRGIITYVVRFKPTAGWDCNDPNTSQPYTGDEPGLPLWVQAYCTYDGNASPAGYYPPAADADGNRWAAISHNPSSPVSVFPSSTGRTHGINIPFLTDGQEYQVQVAARLGRDADNNVVQGEWSEVEKATPTARKPGAPRNLLLTPGDGSLAAAWDEPQDPGSPRLDGYVVRYRQVTDPVSGWTRLLTTDANTDLVGLTNHQEYEVAVAAFHREAVTAAAGVAVTYVLSAPVSGLPCPTDSEAAADCYVVIDTDHIGPYTETVTATPDAEHLPGAPRNLRLFPSDGRLAVLWDPPELLGNPELDGYVVQHRQAGETEWTGFITDATDTELDELVNDQEYQVRVAAYHRTAVDAPAGVRVAYVLAVADVPAPEAGQPPVQPCPTDGTEPTADCYVVIDSEHIGPYATETGTPQALVQVEIAEEDPAMPRNLRLVPGVGQITAQWDAPTEPDDGHAGYAVQYRAVGDATWIDATRIIYGDTDDDPNTPDIEETQENRRAVITGLEGRSYQVRVASLLIEGAGHVTGTYTAPVTAEATGVRTPGRPRNLTAAIGTSPNDGSRHIDVFWNAPTETGNPAGISGYSVQYRRAGASGWTDWTSSPRRTSSRFWAEIGIGSADDYEVRVAAVGVLGHIGSYATAGQAHRPPTGVLNLTLTPGDGQIEAVWDPPADAGNPPFEGYYVSYRVYPDDGSATTWQSSQQSGTTKTFTGLANDQPYEVRILVANSAGPASVKLVAIPSATGGDPVVDPTPDPEPEPEPADPGLPRVPGPPRNLVLTPGDGRIAVSWDAPTDVGNPPLTRYRVDIQITVTRWRVNVTWVGQYETGTTTVFEALENGISYTIRVAAVNAQGRSQTVTATAEPQAPEPEPQPEPDPPTDDGGSDVGDADDGQGEDQGPAEDDTSDDDDEGDGGEPDNDPKRPPTAPRNVRLTVGDEEIGVSWDTPRDIGDPDAWIGYVVQVRRTGESGWVDAGFHRGTSGTIDWLQNGVEYQVRVVAFNKWGEAGTRPKTATPTGT